MARTNFNVAIEQINDDGRFLKAIDIMPFAPDDAAGAAQCFIELTRTIPVDNELKPGRYRIVQYEETEYSDDTAFRDEPLAKFEFTVGNQ